MSVDQSEVITVTRLGHTFQCCRFCLAHLDSTIAALAKQHPGARLVILQTPFNVGVAASAGTHDFCSAFDFIIVGLGWWEGQWFLRTQGWAAWFRHTGTWAAERLWHLHSVSIGCKARVGIFIPGQLDDYRRHALGLKGEHDSGADTSMFPADIDSTIFDFAQWERELEDAMPYKDWPQADRLALVADVAAAVVPAVIAGLMAEPISSTPKTTFKQGARLSAEAARITKGK